MSIPICHLTIAPAAVHHYDQNDQLTGYTIGNRLSSCIGSQCAMWDPKPLPPLAVDDGWPSMDGRCGFNRRGTNFPDPALATTETT